MVLLPAPLVELLNATFLFRHNYLQKQILDDTRSFVAGLG